MLTGRAENHIRGVDDLDDTIERLVAYRDAGADCLYAPGLTDLEQIRRVVDEVGAPVNVLALPAGPPIGELEAIGVRRISTGSLLAGVAYGAARRRRAGAARRGNLEVRGRARSRATCSRARSARRHAVQHAVRVIGEPDGAAARRRARARPGGRRARATVVTVPVVETRRSASIVGKPLRSTAALRARHPERAARRDDVDPARADLVGRLDRAGRRDRPAAGPRRGR